MQAGQEGGGTRKLGLRKMKRRDLSQMGDSQEINDKPPIQPRFPPPPPPPTSDKTNVKENAPAFSEVIKFQKQKLKRTKTRERLFLPSKEEMSAERARQELLNKLQGFNKRGLRHVAVKEKNVLPSKEDLEQERKLLKLPKAIVNPPIPPPTYQRTPSIPDKNQPTDRPKRILKIKKPQNSLDAAVPPPPPPPSTVPPPPPPPSHHKIGSKEKDAKAEVLKGVVGFKKENLKRTKTRENLFLPTKEVVSAERAHQELLNKLNSFNKGKLKHVQVKEKVVLPSKEDLEVEREILRLPKLKVNPIPPPPPPQLIRSAHPPVSTPPTPPTPFKGPVKDENHQQVLTGVVGFKKEKLKRTNTQEKIILPTKEVVDEEKARLEMLSKLEGFNKRKLRHVVVKEKSVLPTKEDMEEERRRLRLKPLVIAQPTQPRAGPYDEIEEFVANLDINDDEINLAELSDDGY